MSILYKICRLLVSIIFIVYLQIMVDYFLPTPFNDLNISSAILILIMLFRKQGSVVWLGFVINAILEIFFLERFGIILTASTLSFLLVYWLAWEVFANRSILIAATVTIVYEVVYRLFYLIFLYTAQYSQNIPLVDGKYFFLQSAFELILTTGMAIFLYFVIDKIFLYRKNITLHPW